MPHGLILFGGLSSGGSRLAETWAWDGDDWSQLSPTSSPTARSWCSSMWDSTSSRHILFGGSSGGGYLDDTWEFDGATWTDLSPATTPPAREVLNPLLYDVANDRGVLFDGFNGSDVGGSRIEDQYLWDGTDWTSVTPSPAPDYRRSAGFGYDDNTSKSVLFSGTQIVDAADTWTWDGTDWTEVSTAHAPNSANFGLHGAALAYDPITGKLLLAGGNRGTDVTTFQTWTWTGTDWTQLSPATSPTERAGSMALDPNLGQLVFYGGVNRTGTKFDETWTWDGSTWTELLPANTPNAVSGFALAPFVSATRKIHASFGLST